MLTFGLIASGSLWTYWHYHTAPFIPLQVAIANEFKASSPRVDGGQRKMHKGTPKLLWIVLRVQFNPETETDRALKVAERVVELATEHLDLTEFEQLNVRQFFDEYEKMLHRVDYKVPLDNGVPGEPELSDDLTDEPVL